MRVMWLGTYERDYPRTRILIDGLRHHGVEVIENHRPVFERQTDKITSGLRPLALMVTGLRWLAAWATLPWSVLRAGRVDAIVAGYLAQPDAIPGWIAARVRRVPFMVDMMISLEDTLAGDRGVAGRRAKALLGAIDRTALRLADVVLVDTAAHASFFTERFGVSPEKIVVAAVGADPQAFPTSPAPTGAPTVLFYGKLSPLHGVETVIAASQMEGVPALRVIGDGQLGGWLREKLGQGEVPNVRWDPWVPYEDLASEIADAAICLGVFGTSEKASRVVPNKVWQAMAVGRPVITGDTPGIRGVIEHGRNGYLVPPGNPTALADALRTLVDDPELRARLGTAARETYRAMGAPEVVAEPVRQAVERTARRRSATVRSK